MLDWSGKNGDMSGNFVILSEWRPWLCKVPDHCYCLWRINFRGVRGKTDHESMGNKTDKPSIAI